MTTKVSKGKAKTPTVDPDAASSPLVNLRKQIKYVILGGVFSWYWQVPLHLSDVLGGSAWSK